MTRRRRHVRVSVRPLAETVDATWLVESQSFAHARYQRLSVLEPLSGREVLRMSRRGWHADWRAEARTRPAIPDGAMLVTYDYDGNADLRFRVVKALPGRRRTELLLREIREEQS